MAKWQPKQVWHAQLAWQFAVPIAEAGPRRNVQLRASGTTTRSPTLGRSTERGGRGHV